MNVNSSRRGFHIYNKFDIIFILFSTSLMLRSDAFDSIINLLQRGESNVFLMTARRGEKSCLFDLVGLNMVGRSGLER